MQMKANETKLRGANIFQVGRGGAHMYFKVAISSSYNDFQTKHPKQVFSNSQVWKHTLNTYLLGFFQHFLVN